MAEDERDFLEATLPHLDAVNAIARHLCRDRWQAEDVVQETYLRAFSSFASHRGESTRAWLSAICVNVVRGDWRRQSRRVAEAHMGSAEELVVSAGCGYEADDEVFRRVEASLDREVVVRALAKLPLEQRLAIVLMDLAGSSAREVAAIVGAPRGTVLARVHRGRRKLAQILEEQGVDRDLS